MGNPEGCPEENRTLSAREEVFCQAYCTIGSKNWSNATQSKDTAGYSSRTMGSAIFNKVHIRSRIDEILKALLDKLGLSPEKVLLGIISDQVSAREAGQWAVSNQCSRLLGETYAMFSEKMIIAAHVIHQPKLDYADMTDTEKLKYNSEQKAIDEACRAYKLSLADAGTPIERGRDNPVKSIPSVDVSKAAEEPYSPDKPEQPYEPEEKIPAHLVGRSPGKPNQSASSWK